MCSIPLSGPPSKSSCCIKKYKGSEEKSFNTVDWDRKQILTQKIIRSVQSLGESLLKPACERVQIKSSGFWVHTLHIFLLWQHLNHELSVSLCPRYDNIHPYSHSFWRGRHHVVDAVTSLHTERKWRVWTLRKREGERIVRVQFGL